MVVVSWLLRFSLVTKSYQPEATASKCAKKSVRYPGKIVCDNGTEFTSKAMFFWQKDTGVQLGFIQPGKPTQNAFVESLNGKFRNECLNQYWFKSIEEAREEIDAWRHHYNNERPHSALNYMSPVAFAAKAA